MPTTIRVTAHCGQPFRVRINLKEPGREPEDIAIMDDGDERSFWLFEGQDMTVSVIDRPEDPELV